MSETNDTSVKTSEILPKNAEKDSASTSKAPKKPSKRPGNNRKVFPTKKAKPTPDTFEKRAKPPVHSVYPIDTYYSIITSFLNIPMIATLYYDLLRTTDSKLTQAFTVDEFTYVILLAAIYRCATVASRSTIIFGLTNLSDIISHVLLPDAIATFIETMGIVTLTNTLKVIPFFGSYTVMRRTPGFLDPMVLVRRINDLRRQEVLEPYIIDDEDWSLCAEIVNKYQLGISRAMRKNIAIRELEWSNVEGRQEFLTSYEVVDDRTRRCFACDSISIEQCKLGSAFGYRSLRMAEEVGPRLTYPFTCPDIKYRTILTDHFVLALRQ